MVFLSLVILEALKKWLLSTMKNAFQTNPSSEAREINASSISREKNGLPSISLRPKLSLLKHDLSFIYPFETAQWVLLIFMPRRTSERLDKQVYRSYGPIQESFVIEWTWSNKFRNERKFHILAGLVDGLGAVLEIGTLFQLGVKEPLSARR